MQYPFYGRFTAELATAVVGLRSQDGNILLSRLRGFDLGLRTLAPPVFWLPSEFESPLLERAFG